MNNSMFGTWSTERLEALHKELAALWLCKPNTRVGRDIEVVQEYIRQELFYRYHPREDNHE